MKSIQFLKMVQTKLKLVTLMIGLIKIVIVTRVILKVVFAGDANWWIMLTSANADEQWKASYLPNEIPNPGNHETPNAYVIAGNEIVQVPRAEQNQVVCISRMFE